MTKEHLDKIKRDTALMFGVSWNKLIKYNLLLDDVVNKAMIQAVNEAIEASSLMNMLISECFGKYQITFQFWSEVNNSVFIEKNNVELWDAGGFETPLNAMLAALNYLDKINNKKRKQDLNF